MYGGRVRREPDGTVRAQLAPHGPDEVEASFGAAARADAALAELLRAEQALFDASNRLARRARISPMALTMDPMCVLPFNPDRVLVHFCEEEASDDAVPLDADYVREVLSCQEQICALAMGSAPRHCLVSALRFCFRSRLLSSLALPLPSVRRLFRLLTQYFEEAMVAAGEMVGTIAATSMGEVTTQLTLNSFHTSGVGSRAVTAGIPRLKEILDVTRKMRTPSNCLVLKEPYGSSPDFATRFARTLGKTMLSDLVCRVDLLYEPDPFHTDVDNDRMMVEIESFISAPERGSSHWVARLSLSKSECQARDVTPPDIQSLLVEKLGREAQVSAARSTPSSGASASAWPTCVT